MRDSGGRRERERDRKTKIIPRRRLFNSDRSYTSLGRNNDVLRLSSHRAAFLLSRLRHRADWQRPVDL